MSSGSSASHNGKPAIRTTIGTRNQISVSRMLSMTNAPNRAQKSA
jgi:hypothetical protein